MLWCTGGATSGRLRFGLDVLDELGLRLVGVNRPGLADSSPHATKTLTSWCQDVAEVLRGRGWDSPPVVGFSQGAVFALALGAAGLVGPVAVVQDDLASMTDRLPAAVASFVRLAGSEPAAFEDECAAPCPPRRTCPWWRR